MAIPKHFFYKRGIDCEYMIRAFEAERGEQRMLEGLKEKEE
jgi:hypothetical protein